MQNPMRLGQWPGKTFNLPVVGCVLLSLVLSGCTPTDQKSASVAPEATAPALPAVAPQQSAPAPNPHESRHVRQLIQQVEQAYALGEADYRKGRLADAKAEFDRAVDLMLLSGIDIKADPSLQEEFDHILDKVNALETEALKRGNGFVPQQEETPAEAAAEVTFKVDPNLVAKAQADLATTKSDLPLVVNDYVAAFINFFANTKRGHNTLLYSLQRAGRYRAMIQRVMAEEGVPQDLIYLAVAESGFNPRALNRKSGAGRRGRAAGSDLPGCCRVRFSAASAQWALARGRDVAIHAVGQLWAGAQRLCGRAFRS
jgi:membrane-bound lytic murein transglycosylase D